jgi:hypothetical protein
MFMSDKPELGNQTTEILLWQYRECWTDVRQYDNLIWQIPSLTTIIVGTMIALSSTALITIRIVLFVVALSLNIVMTIALYKHQFFRIYRFREIEKIQEAFKKSGLLLIADGARSMKIINEQTEKGIVREMPKGWFYRRTAYNWIRIYMHVLTIALALGLIVSIIWLRA